MGESARFGRNFAAIAAAQFIAQILTFVLSFTLARTLGASLYGLYAFGFAFPSLLLLLVSAGFDEVVAIDVAAERSRARSYLTIVAALRLPLAAMAAVALWLSVGLLLDDPLARLVTIMLGMSALLQTYAGTFLSFFRAFERLEYMAVVVLVERCFTVTVAVVLLSFGYGLFEVALGFLAGGGLTLAMSILLLRRTFTWFAPGLDRGVASSILRKATPFALGGVISTVTPSTGPVLLTILRNPIDTGLFNAALTLLFAVFSILTLYNLVLLPTMARIRAASPERLAPVLENTQRFLFALGVPAALGAAIYAEEIMTLFYGEAFVSSGAPFRVLMVAVAIVSACMGNGTVLAASGRQRINLYVGGAATAVIVGLSVLLIPALGPLGAAIGFVAGSGVTGVLGTIATRRYVVRIDLFNTLGRPSLAAGGMALALLLLQPPLWLGIPTGAVAYLAFLYVVGGIRKGDWRMVRDAMRGALGRES